MGNLGVFNDFFLILCIVFLFSGDFQICWVNFSRISGNFFRQGNFFGNFRFDLFFGNFSIDFWENFKGFNGLNFLGRFYELM